MKKIMRATLALAILFLATSAVATTTQFDGPAEPPMCFPGQACS